MESSWYICSSRRRVCKESTMSPTSLPSIITSLHIFLFTYIGCILRLGCCSSNLQTSYRSNFRRNVKASPIPVLFVHNKRRLRFSSTSSSFQKSRKPFLLINSQYYNENCLYHLYPSFLPRFMSSKDNSNSDNTSTTLLSTSVKLKRQSLRQSLSCDYLKKSDTLSTQRLNGSLDKVQVIGHRGAIYEYLENTIESFLFCTSDKCQCDGVELDVFVIKDGTIVVFHGCDDNPNIPGSLKGYCLPSNRDLVYQNDGCTYRSIMDLTYQETQQLNFNPNFEEFVCPKECINSAKIPTLQDVLEQLSQTNISDIKIELKGPGTVQPVLSLVEQLQLEAKCSYSSFDHELLLELRTLRPNKELYRTGALFNAPVPDDYIQKATVCGATAIHLRYDDCTVDRIQNIHDNKFVSMAWFRGPLGMKYDALNRFYDIGGSNDNSESNFFDETDMIENENCYRIMLDTGVQQICCNRPDLLMRILKES